MWKKRTTVTAMPRKYMQRIELLPCLQSWMSILKCSCLRPWRSLRFRRLMSAAATAATTIARMIA
jgi:hypothetical protein